MSKVPSKPTAKTPTVYCSGETRRRPSALRSNEQAGDVDTIGSNSFVRRVDNNRREPRRFGGRPIYAHARYCNRWAERWLADRAAGIGAKRSSTTGYFIPDFQRPAKSVPAGGLAGGVPR